MSVGSRAYKILVSRYHNLLPRDRMRSLLDRAGSRSTGEHHALEPL
jgi:hypothetical protein